MIQFETRELRNRMKYNYEWISYSERKNIFEKVMTYVPQYIHIIRSI